MSCARGDCDCSCPVSPDQFTVTIQEGPPENCCSEADQFIHLPNGNRKVQIKGVHQYVLRLTQIAVNFGVGPSALLQSIADSMDRASRGAAHAGELREEHHKAICAALGTSAPMGVFALRSNAAMIEEMLRMAGWVPTRSLSYPTIVEIVQSSLWRTKEAEGMDNLAHIDRILTDNKRAQQNEILGPELAALADQLRKFSLTVSQSDVMHDIVRSCFVGTPEKQREKALRIQLSEKSTVLLQEWQRQQAERNQHPRNADVFDRKKEASGEFKSHAYVVVDNKRAVINQLMKQQLDDLLMGDVQKITINMPGLGVVSLDLEVAE